MELIKYHLRRWKDSRALNKKKKAKCKKQEEEARPGYLGVAAQGIQYL